MRRDIRIKKWIDAFGGVTALLGLSGIAGAAEGEGNIVVAITVFIIGFSIVLWGYQR
jgi:uncharacterized membrane protein YtjA (UPF0391 family)